MALEKRRSFPTATLKLPHIRNLLWFGLTTSLLLLLTVLPRTVQAQNVLSVPPGIAVATTTNAGLIMVQPVTQTVTEGTNETGFTTSTSTIISDPPISVPAPTSVVGFDDVAVDILNQIVVALDATTRRLCSYQLVVPIAATSSQDQDSNATLQLANCVRGTFQVAPYTGISASKGLVAISGGTGGVTVYEYNVETGMIDTTPLLLNDDESLSEVAAGFHDVLLLSDVRAVLSAQVVAAQGGFSSFVVDLTLNTTANNNTSGSIFGGGGGSNSPELELDLVREFPVEDSLGFSLARGPSNFPFQHAAFETGTEETYLFVANGGMTVQDPNIGGWVRTIEPILEEEENDNVGGDDDDDDSDSNDNVFRAVTVAVNQELSGVVFGGLMSGSGSGSQQSVLYLYAIQLPASANATEADNETSNSTNSTGMDDDDDDTDGEESSAIVKPIRSILVDGRITSVTSSGEWIFYLTTTSGNQIHSLPLNDANATNFTFVPNNIDLLGRGGADLGSPSAAAPRRWNVAAGMLLTGAMAMCSAAAFLV